MRNLFLITILLSPAALLQAQSSLYLSPNASFYISAGTPVSIEGLVLTPTTGYNISGSNSLQRTVTPLHPGGNLGISRVYQWTNTLPPFTGNVSFYYLDTELNGLKENELTLNVHNGIGWNAYINNVIRNSSDNVVTTTLSGVALNELMLAAAVQGPLPMVWLEVDAQRRNNVIQVSWQTAEETNCAGYQVEKSSNGTNWSNLGNLVKANNTTGLNTYSLQDVNLPVAISFYRIKQLDLDGRHGYSKLVSVKSDRSGGVWLYPIPANTVLTIVAGGNQQLRSVNIYNTVGALVASAQPQRTASHTINLNHLASGNYTAVIVLMNNTTITRNFIKR